MEEGSIWRRVGELEARKSRKTENLLDPACSGSQSQPAHLARDAASLPAWVEEGSIWRRVGGLGGFGRVWEGGSAWEACECTQGAGMNFFCF